MNRLFILLILFSQSLLSQSAEEISSGLDLKTIPFGKAPNLTETLKPYILEDDTQTSLIKLNHDYFSSVEYRYDQNNRLFSATYYFKSNRAVDRNKENIYSVFSTAFNTPMEELPRKGNITFNFDGKNYRAVLNFEDHKSEYRSSITIIKHSPIIDSKYDEFNKANYLSVLNTPNFVKTENGEEISISFYAVVSDKAKNLYMRIGSNSNNWKFIDRVYFLTKDKEVVEIPLDADWEIDDLYMTKENAYVIIPKDLAYKIDSVDDVKIRVSGKENYDLYLLNSQVLALQSVRSALYN